MQQRLHVIRSGGKAVLLVDFAACSAQEVEAVTRIVPEYVTAQPLGSVLILADFTGAIVNSDGIRALKEAAVFDKAHVAKSAFVGVDSVPRGLEL